MNAARTVQTTRNDHVNHQRHAYWIRSNITLAHSLAGQVTARWFGDFLASTRHRDLGGLAAARQHDALGARVARSAVAATRALVIVTGELLAALLVARRAVAVTAL